MSIESVQFAIFLSPGSAGVTAHIAAKHLFPDRFPNSFNEVGPGQTVATFNDQEYQTVVGSAPGRHDIIISRITGETRPGSLPVDSELVRANYLDLVTEFARIVGAVRLAVVIKSGISKKSTLDALDEFRAVVTSVQLPANANEADFKINVPKQFRVAPHLKMNRLHRWSTGTVMFLAFGPTGPRAGTQQALFSDEIDVNSDHEARIDPAAYAVIMAELFDEALHHAGKGPDSLEELPGAS